MLHTAAALDAVDRSLLEALQKDGRATVGELAERVSLSTSPCWRRVRQVEALPQVLSCYNLSGRYDYQIELVAPDLETFAEYVRTRIRSLPGVREISTSFSLKEVKRTVALPVAP